MKVRLGDVATYINGYAFKPSDWSTVGTPIIRIQDLTGNSYKQNRYNGDYEKRYEISSGDILISWSASLGVYIWAGEKAVLNQHIFKVVFDKINVNKNFFIHQVKSILEKASTSAHGATMKHLTRPTFNSLPFYLPDINTQNKIAMVLDNLESTISNKAKVLSLLDQLVKSRFMEMFGDPWNDSNKYPLERLSNLSEKITDGVHKKPTYTQSGRPFLSVVNINKRVVDFSNCKFISNNDFDLIAKSNIANKGDILYTKVGATYGIAAHVETDIKFALYVSVCLIKPKHNIINSCFLAHSMNMPYVKYQADRRVKGIGVPDLHLNQIREFSIIVPPLPLQQQFAAFVEKVDKSKLAVKQSLEKLETLKKSLMQQYFG